MNWDTLARKAIHAWERWRFDVESRRLRRRLLKRNPELRLIEKAEHLARRQHRPVEQFKTTKQAVIVHALREGL
jgi:hypothetical protein